MIALVLAAMIAQADAGTPEKPVALRIDRPSVLAIQGAVPEQSKVIDLPPGYFLPDEAFGVVNLEVARLQRREADLVAQNQNLGETLARRPPSIGLGTLMTVALGGIALGAVACYALLPR